MKLLILTFTISLSFVFHSQINKYGFEKFRAENGDKATSFAIVNDGEVLSNLIKENKLLVKSVTKEYIYVTTTANIVASLYQEKKINDFYFSVSKPIPMNDSSRVTHFVNQVHQGTDGLDASYTGKNVIIGYVDTGCDFQHPDFKDANGNSRIIRYWDHNLPFDAVRTPAEYGYGQIFDSVDLNNMIPIPDCSSGHGSTVAGAGSANGLANGTNAGMAPDSKIIIVDFDFSGTNANWTLDVADACKYIFDIADQYGLPAVVNLSLGTYFGSHDGNDPASVLMEALIDEKPGRIIISSAGNGGNFQGSHVHNVVDTDTSFFWMQANPANQVTFFDLWGTVGEVENINFSYSLVDPLTNYVTRGETPYYNVFTSFGTPIFEFIRNVNGDTLARIESYMGVQNGAYNLYTEVFIDSSNYYFSFNTTGSGTYDAWTRGEFGAAYQFFSAIPDAVTYPSIVNYVLADSLQTLVSEWNCSEKIISVGNVQNRVTYTDLNGGSHDDMAILPDHGEIATSSSIGPSRLGVQKPEICASGDRTFSAAPLCFLQDPNVSDKVLEGGWHARNGGTSMAAPLVAGVAGLYLEKCPKSTYQDFMNDLIATAFSDQYTGTLPNYAYGYGKVHALNLLLATDYTVSITGNDTYCGTPVTLSASSSDVLDTYAWSDGTTNSTMQANAAGTYQLTATNMQGCKSSASKVITQGLVLTPAISISSSDNTICAGDLVTFTSTSQNPGTNPDYQWFVDANPTGNNSPAFSSSSLTDGQVVTCQLTSSEQCVTQNGIVSNGITMQVSPVLNPSVTITSDDNNVCEGTMITFTSTGVNGGTSPAYQWFLNNMTVGTNSTTYTNSNLENGDFVYCKLTSNNQCAALSFDISNYVVMNVVTDAVISSQGNMLVCSTNATSYQWYDCATDAAISGATNPTFTAPYTGSFYVTANLGNCEVSSPCLTVTVVGLDESGQGNSIMVYPNPASGIIHIQHPESKTYQVLVKSVSGQLIHSFTTNKKYTEFSVENQTNGMYFIEIVENDGNSSIFKIIKN